ncbi:BZ3500_MvSof-1268-A1-R1_Chr2-1g04346 [Microbotryum saponariae]|uniref:BZ3500_MvSof-1268-A1-R1_Chr2-1g04346 protein n=1 Tax=Microbotryum saponariae TaxID=289078 RepID=A0A2X0M2I0_9BASI|nr:BZ3500_MvSof-1268-A1-R1_Chr2-1g04346 [Microbotryum saponariae]SCZ91500.1 BZ3501_MvSof-1269-A2-R1_Chr2-1g04002 [Microbotryum saponariae]
MTWPSSSSEPILLDIKGPYAIITLNQPAKKNALDLVLYKRLSTLIQSVDVNPSVYITVLTGRGDFFSAGADVKQARAQIGEEDVRGSTLRRLTESNLDLARALYRHSKILVAALNGPAIGLSAALLGHFDFVYAVENAYILTPFSALSLVAEGGSSLSFPRRMGIVKANEALILGKKLGASELQQNGFFNKIFPQSSDAAFVQSLMTYLKEKFATLDLDACLKTKQLIKQTLPDPDPSNIRELFAAAEQFASGRPQQKFADIAAKKMRHKL